MNGLRPVEQFNARLEYGNLWHVCEEEHAKGGPDSRRASDGYSWNGQLRKYAQELCQRYPLQQEEVDKWYNVCLKQFPLYIDFWKKHPDVTGRTPLLQEWNFNVPYKLPSGRTVRLRGKMDGADLIDGIWIAEHKSKGDIDEEKIRGQLSYDLQTLLYQISFQEAIRQHLGGADVGLPEEAVEWGHKPILGVRYNVIRRPLSGGKGSIVRHKGKPSVMLKSGKWSKDKPEETKADYYARLAKYIEKEPETYFMRWQVRISSADVERFKRECLHPVLENLCDDYEWWLHCSEKSKLAGAIGMTSPDMVWDYKKRHYYWPEHQHRSFRVPYGIYSSLIEDTHGELDEHLKNGSTTGLRRTENLFPELQ